MSCRVTESLPKKDSTFVSELLRKPKKRRHRNRFKNSNIRKKRVKKLFISQSNSYKSNIFKLSGGKNMSNWYWSNYNKALQWQDKHKIAHWKACALALLEENRYLLQIINNMQPDFDPKVPVTNQNFCGDKDYININVKQTPLVNCTGFYNFYRNQCNNDDFDDDNENEHENDADADEDAEERENSNESDDIDFEMSEEMMQYFEQSYKHKMHIKKMQEKESLNNAEQEVNMVQNNKVKRVSEMSFLYGEGASMITGMETAVQLSFDKYCDTKSPKYWPNIPLRL